MKASHNDTRALKVGGQTEERRYRLCLWGHITRVWSPVIEVVFGGQV